MTSEAPNVSAYIAEQAEERQPTLKKLRALIKKAAPGVKEAMTYGMPTYTLNGANFVAFAAQVQYFAVYVSDTALVAERKASLGKLSVGKSCIRFKAMGDINLEALTELLKASVARRANALTRS